MKKFLIPVVGAALLATSFNVFAYGGGKHAEHGVHHLKMLEKKLDLSEAQKAELAALREAMKAERSEHKGDRRHSGLWALDPSAPDYEEQVAELAKQKADQAEQRVLRQAQMQAKIHAILTPEQREELKTLRAERAQRWADKRAKQD